METFKTYLLPLSLFLGMVLGAFILGRSLERFKQEQRYITVKGFSEKEVQADLVIWTIKVRVANNNLIDGNNALVEAKQKVMGFLTSKGIQSAEITTTDLTVTDIQASEYAANNNANQMRYIIEERIQVRSNQVEKVQQISRMTSELLSAGVALSTKNDWQGSGLRFMFTKLNDIKPGMIAEAIQNARGAAEQFAKESDTRLGGIRNANQGLFSIMDRDESSAGQVGEAYGSGSSDLYKRIRVVISVDYTVQPKGWF